MRVLYWTEFMSPYIGGMEVFLADLLPALVRRGLEITAVTSRGWLDLPAHEVTPDGIAIHRLPFRKALGDRDPAACLELRRAVRRLVQAVQPDAVHLQSPGVAAAFYPGDKECFRMTTPSPQPSPPRGEGVVAAVRAAPIMLTVHHELADFTDSPSGQSLFSELVQRADHVVGVSEAVRHQVEAYAPVMAGCTSVIYNGVGRGRRAIPLPFDPPRLLCLGRMLPLKGFDVAIAAFAHVLKRHPNAELVLAGDGHERPALERQADALGVVNAVRFPGWVNPRQVHALLDSSTVVLVPSHSEALGLAGIEAAMRGRPVVGTDVGGIPEVVQHEKTGLLVSRGDAKAMADAVCRLLDSRAKAVAFGRRARRRALRRFCLDRCADQYAALYRRLADAGDHVTRGE